MEKMSKISRAEYYEKAFDRLEKTGKHTWNWAAFFGGITWMLYRKMYLYGLVLSTVYLVVDYFCLIKFAESYVREDSWLFAAFFEPIAPRLCLMFLMGCVSDRFMYYFKNGLINFEGGELWTIAAVIGFIITRIYLGYFGNSLYYRIVRKRIKEGYYLIDEHPTSIISCFGSIFYLFGLDSHPKLESKHVVNKESIRDYLNPDR